MITANQILAALPLLTNLELEKIRKQAAVLMSLGGGGNKTGSPEPGPNSTDYTHEDFVLQAICKVVRLSNGSPVTPQMLKRASGIMATLREHLPGLMTYIEQIDERHRIAFMQATIQMLVDNIKQQGIPVTPVVVIRQLHRLPAVVDQGFPGYYASGMLNEIVRTHVGGSHGDS